jgi:hypothetical protein
LINNQARHPAGLHLVRRHPVIAILALLAAVFLVATSVLFVWPATDQPRHVDGILSLNGNNEGSRFDTTVALAEKGYAPVLLFSQGAANTTCPKVRKVSVVCFAPNPDQTIGEIKFGAEYARRHGWHSLMIVSGRAQVTEARLLMERCFSGQIVMVPAPRVYLTQLPLEIIHEWGGLAKAVLSDERC